MSPPAADLDRLLGSVYTPGFRRAYALLDRLLVHICLAVVADHDLFVGGRAETEATIASAIDLAPQARYLAGRMLALLAEEGLIVGTGGAWVPACPLPAPDPAQLWEEAWREFPDEPMFLLLRRCEDGLNAFLRGRRTGVEIVFPRGDGSLWAALHHHSLLMSGYARLGAAAVEARLPDGGSVLEVGAGTGAGTGRVLSRLRPGHLARYTYTDVSPVFLDEGRRRFGNDPSLRFLVYDFDRPPTDQGFERAAEDVVYAVNALHVARDLPEALRRLRSLVRPGGWLVLAEGAPPAPGRLWRPDLMFGFLPGWWDVRTDAILRPRGGFLHLGEWERLLAATGFGQVVAIPGGSLPDGPTYGGVVAARVPDAPSHVP